MRTVVHIGYHKTATTWFQKKVYPGAVGARYVPRNVVRAALIDPTAFCFDPETARERLGAGDPGNDGGERLILCEEGPSGYLHNGGLAGFLSKEMVQRIKATLPDADIVIVIRAQPSIIAACYMQYVKGGGTYSVDRYLYPPSYLRGAAAENPRAPRFVFDQFEYDRLIAAYREAFGAERVHVYLYERLRADPRGFLAAMEADLGIALPIDAAALRPVYRSYNRPALLVARFLGLFTSRTVLDKYWALHVPFLYAATRALCEGISRLPLGGAPSPRALFGARLLAWIEARFGPSNRRLAEATGLPLAEHGYPMDMVAHDPAPPVTTLLPGWTRN